MIALAAVFALCGGSWLTIHIAQIYIAMTGSFPNDTALAVFALTTFSTWALAWRIIKDTMWWKLINSKTL
ncbi:hypothetical protein HYP67_gp033 [Acinetobacter phage vB_ApiM_fHyAci03]|uniref:Uncharacterized protein n=1 Tax=Acinetobacter phage vB_ApiM_fHyAci03 TaxID=2269366 RepID=A0A345AUL9_9CAUD|nr:hypothetical protein HYP67_gp033 [Acinetobacter phage vB_ApiM_fHyAci03]AXF40602.1 hypothetical protein Ac3_033 [Acinetobacter phage vB_ApiM_fHyAci03]